MKQKPLFGKGWNLDGKVKTVRECTFEEVEKEWEKGRTGIEFSREAFEFLKRGCRGEDKNDIR